MRQPFDVVITAGTVYDGSGAPGRRADVAVAGDRIAAVGELGGVAAARIVNAAGRAVAPGFIDTHTHSDMASFLADEHLDLKAADVRQGVTTEVCGNCGFTAFPALPARRDALAQSTSLFASDEGPWETLHSYREAVRAKGLHANLAPLVGHGSLRAGVMGRDARAPRPHELNAMERAAQEAFEQGAFGISSGLLYAPAVYAKTEELVALCRAVARYGRPYTTHMRNESDTVDEAIAEALRIGEEGGVPVHISHHKAAGRRNWGRTARTLQTLRAARAQGRDVTLDVYPYTAGSTIVAAVLPPWALDGGDPAMRERLGDPRARARLARELETGLPGWESHSGLAGWDAVVIASSPSHPEFEGHSVQELAADAGRSNENFVFDLLVEDGSRAIMVMHTMNEGDVRNVLAFEASMLGSDGLPVPGKPHPRWAGSFARVLGHYRRDAGMLDLAQWIRKLSGMPAQRFGLRDRGAIATGKIADLVVFDPDTIADRATYDEPLVPPTGVCQVFVNGHAVVSDGRLTGERPGRVLEAR
ncbi:MAG: amidohydrolase family protein [Candidatus Limnocylindria bacterium]